jgi:hypothetical protein
MMAGQAFRGPGPSDLLPRVAADTGLPEDAREQLPTDVALMRIGDSERDGASCHGLLVRAVGEAR